MGKKSSRRRKQGRTLTPAREGALQYPFGATAKDEKLILSLMDRLFQSHAELCVVLRLAGRQLLRVEKQGDESLDKIRKVLKRADHVRKALIGLNEWPETLETMHQSVVASASEYGFGQLTEDGTTRKSVQKGDGLTAPRSSRVIKFPTGSKARAER